jgi:hypothetical protein
MTIEDGFPPVPELTAEWAPVYLEPLQGSGERLVVAVVGIDRSGGAAAQVAAPPRAWKCLYGNDARRIIGLTDLIVDSFEDHAASGGSLGGWIMPSGSCHLGIVRVGLGASLGQILAQGVRLTSSMFDPSVIDAVSAAGDIPSSQDVDRFVQRVKELAIRSASELEHRFRQSISVGEGAKRTEIGYIGIEIAANFEVLRPNVGALERRRTRAKSKLIDLQALRDQKDLLVGRRSYELMLWVPPGFSKEELARSEEVFLELRDIGDNHELRVEKLADPEAAAKRILVAERVA